MIAGLFMRLFRKLRHFFMNGFGDNVVNAREIAGQLNMGRNIQPAEKLLASGTLAMVAKR
jgi:hypothetical protein